MRGGSEKRRGERGQALILAFIFIACVVALGFLGLALSGRFEAVTTGFP